MTAKNVRLSGAAVSSCWKVPIAPIAECINHADAGTSCYEKYFQVGEEARPQDAYEYHETRYLKTLVYRDFAISCNYPNNIVLVRGMGVCKVENIFLATETVYDENTQTSSEKIAQPPRANVYVSAFKKQDDIFPDNSPCKSSDFDCYIVSGGVKRPKAVQTSDILNQVVLLVIRDEDTEKLIATYEKEAAEECENKNDDEEDIDDHNPVYVRLNADNNSSSSSESSSSSSSDDSESSSKNSDDDEEENYLYQASRSKTKRKLMNKLSNNGNKKRSVKKLKQLPPIVFSRLTHKQSIQWIAQPLLHTGL